MIHMRYLLRGGGLQACAREDFCGVLRAMGQEWPVWKEARAPYRRRLTSISEVKDHRKVA